jgi:hypothetical protein
MHTDGPGSQCTGRRGRGDFSTGTPFADPIWGERMAIRRTAASGLGGIRAASAGGAAEQGCMQYRGMIASSHP